MLSVQEKEENLNCKLKVSLLEARWLSSLRFSALVEKGERGDRHEDAATESRLTSRNRKQVFSSKNHNKVPSTCYRVNGEQKRKKHELGDNNMPELCVLNCGTLKKNTSTKRFPNMPTVMQIVLALQCAPQRAIKGVKMGFFPSCKKSVQII